MSERFTLMSGEKKGKNKENILKESFFFFLSGRHFYWVDILIAFSNNYIKDDMLAFFNDQKSN